MHVTLAIVSILAVWWRKDYRQWKNFYPTMQYIALGNLTYNYLCFNHWLWRLTPVVHWLNKTVLEMSYTFITFPFTALMFLAKYPEGQGKWRVFRHYLFWIGLYVFVEAVLIFTGGIKYGYGWGLQWSAIFDCIMFPFLRLHHRYPFLTMLLSIPMALFWIWLFDVPVTVPFDKR